MEIKVNESDVRIDKYLASVTDYSRETITKMIEESYILVNNKTIKPSYKLKENDDILIKDGFVKEMNLEATKMDIDIVYEDEYLMVINKPSGLTVHPGNGNFNNTLVNGLMYYTTNLSSAGDTTRPGIVHRLDKDTSGLMIVAKTNEAHALLADDFKNKRVYREYYALLVGTFPSTTAHIDAPIGRSKTNYNKMEVRAGGKEARTNITVITRYHDYTLVSVVLETGRTHQIRVHTSYVGYPVFNDPVYGREVIPGFGQFLHSKKIRFTHPILKTTLEFDSELPKIFRDFIKDLD